MARPLSTNLAMTNNFEHCLRQKLTSMENSVARIYAVKSQLRNSAEQTRKDISNAIDHQLQCIRAREQELLFKLEAILAEKEQKLCEQQEQLNKAIGACQQSLNCVLRNNEIDSMSVQNMLLKTNTIDLRPKETPNITFEFDPSDLRRDIASFGNIATEDVAKTYESLPVDVEHYEDGTDLLSHKSVLRLNPSSGSTPTPKGDIPLLQQNPSSKTPLSQSINFWLYQMKQANLDNLDDDFEYVRDRVASGSSFEVLNNSPSSDSAVSKSNPEDAFNAHFTELRSTPVDFWLKRDENTGSRFSDNMRKDERDRKSSSVTLTELVSISCINSAEWGC
jgi:hypothetical protein